MELKELREGNYINYSYSNQYSKSGDVILTDRLLWYLIDVGDEWAEIKPIPLTEEWLLKFEFYRYDDGSEIQYYKDFKDYPDNIEVRFYPDGEYWSLAYLGSKIQSVHQLQNLYFALTGTELEITEKYDLEKH